MNNWWTSDPNQKYWVEITDRPDLGRNINAPKRAQQDKKTPGYELLNYVAEGDIIFHWWRKPNNPADRGFYGFSEVVGQMQDGFIPWKSRGRYATGEELTQKPAKIWNLANFNELPRPILMENLNTKRHDISKLIEQLEGMHGKPIYFPFCIRNGRIAANQTYFAKLPIELLRLLEIDFNEKVVKRVSINHQVESKKEQEVGYSRQMDPEKRSTVEKYAEQIVREHLKSLGYEVEKFGKPFDFLATKDDEVVKVEVKGKQDLATSVEVTINEVEVAKNLGGSYRTLLAVVDDISLSKIHEDNWKASGGRLRTWWDMPFEDKSLFPTRFLFILPLD